MTLWCKSALFSVCALGALAVVAQDDCLVVDCSPPYAARTYATVADLPDGGLDNRAVYCREKLVMRKIPAAAQRGGDFWMSVYTLTQAQFVRLTGQPNTSYFSEPEGAEPWKTGYGESAERPVEGLSWVDLRGAEAVTNAAGPVARRSVLGLIRRRTGLAFDLPTDAQWEFACRAGTTGRHNCAGDPFSFGWFGWCGRKHYPGERNHWGATHPVGLLKPNAWGLYDMHANVWEPCRDRYPTNAAWRVIRGGSFSNGPNDCASGFRWHVNPDSCNNAQGVRLVLER